MAVAVVGELVVAGGELLQALGGDGGEVAGELGVLGQHHGAPRHERVDQRLLPHRLGSPPPSPPPTDSASRSSPPPPPVMRWSSLEGAGGVGVVEKEEGHAPEGLRPPAGLVATAVGGLEADLGNSGPRAASGGHGAGVPSRGRRAANVQMGVVLCGERRAADLEPGATGAADLRSADSGGASGIGLGWQPREDLLLGYFCFFHSLFYSIPHEGWRQ